MSRKVRSTAQIGIFVLALGLLVCPPIALAQRGGGGGFVGGGTAGGGGLSGHTGIATGLDTKDDLKDFHQVLAVQASSQQITAFTAVVKNTENASAEAQNFEQQLAKAQKTTELSDGAKTLTQAIETARAANAKFLEELSEPQKSGLREMIKKLSRTDAELEQETKKLEPETIAKVSASEVNNIAQNLEHTLAGFQSEQLGLGQEMSIVLTNATESAALNISPVTRSVNFEDQQVPFTTSGVISTGALQGDLREFKLELTTDMSGLQQDITDVLRSRLNKSDSCGEQITVQGATLAASAPASVVRADVHYERWACFGRGNANEMAEGNGAIEVNLMPIIAADGTLSLTPKIGRVDAQGMLADLLRSGSLGETLRDKISETLLAGLRQGADYKALLPPVARGNVSLQRAHFEGTGSGKMSLVLNGDIKLSSDNVASLSSELKSAETKQQPVSAQSTPR